MVTKRPTIQETTTTSTTSTMPTTTPPPTTTTTTTTTPPTTMPTTMSIPLHSCYEIFFSENIFIQSKWIRKICYHKLIKETFKEKNLINPFKNGKILFDFNENDKFKKVLDKKVILSKETWYCDAPSCKKNCSNCSACIELIIYYNCQSQVLVKLLGSHGPNFIPTRSFI
jgi:hypothetical protein